ncbi:transmembrane and death domain protein 1-like isoform X3 [Dunckerocampus dactyliophorus]|uniref:transmembrane and death domain protein 1-like isoform X3 n=1 Tax=Dunckerocampus dactyliophorus TaxID=161453 RepID=UPI0024055F67|nr:transmembrane and death domain protein 1-like isoform X3 [Dunckerocampus dactyliophorus]
MQVWELAFLLLLVGQSLALKEDEEDTVVEDIGVHQLERLVELLTSPECEELLVALSNPEKNIFQHVERLSEKNNELLVKHRITRDTASLEDSEAKCRADLTAWLEKYGPQTYYDRLLRALHHIGRADIALASDLTWHDLDLIVLQPPVPAYTKGPLDVALPLLYGILLGFGGTLLAAVSTLLAILRITNWNRTVRQPRVVCYPSWEVLVEN